MVNKTIKFMWYGKDRPKTEIISGKGLAEKLGIDPKRYADFYMPRVQLEGSNPGEGMAEFIFAAIDRYTIRPEEIFTSKFKIEIPKSLKIKTNCLCNSGDILMSDYIFKNYHLYLGKFGEDNWITGNNLMIGLLRDSLESCLYIDSARSAMQRVFSPR